VKKLALFIALGFVGLVVLLLVQTSLLESRQLEADPVKPIRVDEQLVVDHLARALRFRTISSHEVLSQNSQPFLRLHDYLGEVFPESHQTLQREIVSDKSLLFRWPGSEKALQPILLLAHLDVVPVEDGTESFWTHQAFAGHVGDGYIWGRGALDDKVRVLAILEAVEILLKEGFRPRRALYLAFGHDEEVGGRDGAKNIAALLKKRGMKFEVVLDEGGAITENVLPGISQPIALIGIAEKGYLTVELAITEEGGHSSMPPPHTAIGILSTAIHRLESHQFASRINGGTAKLFEYLAPAMPLSRRAVLANLWLFRPLVEFHLASKPFTNATIRTTLAVTMFESGAQDNVLPRQARAVINLRILPGDTIEGVTSQIRNVLHDHRITVRPIGILREPSSQSRVDSWGFTMVDRTIRQVFPDTLVAPFLVLGSTDSYHYQGLAPDTYRFSPIRVSKDDLKSIHGTDERISIQHYLACVRFYYQLIRNLAS